MSLILAILTVDIKHATFIIFAFNIELASANLLLLLKAPFRVLIDEALHPINYGLLVELYKPVKRKELLRLVPLKIEIKGSSYHVTGRLHLLVTNLLEDFNHNSHE